LRDIGVIEAILGQHTYPVVKHPTAAQVNAVADQLPSAGIACRHVKSGARFNGQVVGQGVAMVVGVVAPPVVSALIRILILHDRIKRVMIVHAGTYLRKASGSQDTGGEG
jgi:hypothetical protein